MVADMASNQHEDEQNHVEIVNNLRPLLVENLIPGQVVPYLVDFLPSETPRDLRTMARSGQRAEATGELLDDLIQHNAPGWFSAFITALEKAEFSYLAELLTGFGRLPQEDRFARKLIKVFLPDLITVDCRALMPHLLSNGCLTSRDSESINAYYRNHGSSSAALYMIQEHLAGKSKDWFSKFIRALSLAGYEHLVEIMEPKLKNAGSEASVCRITREMKNMHVVRPDAPSTSAASDEQEHVLWSAHSSGLEAAPGAMCAAPSDSDSIGDNLEAACPKASYMSKDYSVQDVKPKTSSYKTPQPAETFGAGDVSSSGSSQYDEALRPQPEQKTQNLLSAADKVQNIPSACYSDDSANEHYAMQQEQEQNPDTHPHPAPVDDEEDEQEPVKSFEMSLECETPNSRGTKNTQGTKSSYTSRANTPQQTTLNIPKQTRPPPTMNASQAGPTRVPQQTRPPPTMNASQAGPPRVPQQTRPPPTMNASQAGPPRVPQQARPPMTVPTASGSLMPQQTRPSITATNEASSAPAPNLKKCGVCKRQREKVACVKCNHKTVCEGCAECQSCRRKPAAAAQSNASQMSSGENPAPSCSAPQPSPAAKSSTGPVKKCSVCRCEGQMVPCERCGRKVVCQRKICSICKNCRRS